MQVKQNCPYNIPIIEQYAIMMHKIICHTIRFLKLLYLDRFEVNLIININEIITQSIPLKEELIVSIAKIICSPTNMCQSTILCHGLVRCTNCHRLWNRDTNAASDI